MITIIVSILAGILGAGYIKWKVTTFALIYYNEKNQYKHPNKKEMEECTGFVLKNMIKDLTGH